MTGFNAGHMNLGDRGRIKVSPPISSSSTRHRRRPLGPCPIGIDTVVLNGAVVVSGGRFDRTSRAGQVLRRQ
jgi:hypothetical protein